MSLISSASCCFVFSINSSAYFLWSGVRCDNSGKYNEYHSRSRLLKMLTFLSISLMLAIVWMINWSSETDSCMAFFVIRRLKFLNEVKYFWSLNNARVAKSFS